MIKNYNGYVNRKVMNGLRKLCMVNSQNREELFLRFYMNGGVSFCSNLDPLTDCPDELSDIVTLRSEQEVEDYLKRDFKKQLDEYITRKKISISHLLENIITYLMENDGIYPEKDEMRKIEVDAEAKRKAELTETEINQISAEDMLLKEILELSEDVMETRRETNPEDILVHVEPYDDELYITDYHDFEALIMCDSHYGNGDNSDYKLHTRMQKDNMEIKFLYRHYDKMIYAHATDDYGHNVEMKDIMDHIITVHKGMCDIARQEGIEFTSEVDYEKIF